ncbi:hypothetical protein V495_07524 [Pseudogymnoascus sp. VKM F-4514 (FW-929)]|nr:hypothetical protein V495_07524 [Pseudogymnoascus sp. VKM F-4514 (FW-929)]KFY53757.1 hypothetical protein V497_08267 [Pseudogymnoascus sp. VKM F-4516 (FW-969)]
MHDTIKAGDAPNTLRTKDIRVARVAGDAMRVLSGNAYPSETISFKLQEASLLYPAPISYYPFPVQFKPLSIPNTMAFLLKGSAFVTGAGSGIGRATALAFAKYGAKRLSLVDCDGSSLEATSKLIKKAHPAVQILEHAIDVAKEEKVQTAMSQTAAEFGRVDVAVNVAGIYHGVLTHECKTEDWRNVLGINLDGLWFCQREEIKQMLVQEDRGPREGRVAIINVSSVAGLFAGAGTAYTASKHAVIGITRNDAVAYASKGIRVNVICPGWTDTPLIRRAQAENPEFPNIAKARAPMARMADPEEIADAIVFLGSRMAGFMTGAVVPVDGGYSAA